MFRILFDHSNKFLSDWNKMIWHLDNGYMYHPMERKGRRVTIKGDKPK